MQIAIESDSIGVFEKIGGRNIEVVCWAIDEWVEDPSVVFAIANAIIMVTDDPLGLLHIHKAHIDSQILPDESESFWSILESV